MPRASLAGLEEGEAVLRATATRPGTWLLQPQPSVEERRLPVSFRPPSLEVRSTQNYVAQGGAARVAREVALGAEVQVEGPEGALEAHARTPSVARAQTARSDSARRARAWLRSRLRVFGGSPATGGNSPKFTFIGWKRPGSAPIR